MLKLFFNEIYENKRISAIDRLMAKKGNPPSLTDAPPEEAAQLALKTSAQDLSTLANQFSSESLCAIVRVLHAEQDRYWKEKLWGLVSSIQSRKRMEVLGTALSQDQLLYLLNGGKGTIPLIANAIPALFVGLSHDEFLAFLAEAKEGQLAALKREAGTEPIQHHLVVMAREMAPRLDKYISALLGLEQEIMNVVPPLSNEAVAVIERKIVSAAEEAEATINLLRKALGISWNTNREDLVDALGVCKENWQKFRLLAVGMPSSEGGRATGLYAAFESQLGKVFANKDEPAILDDNTPAIDALINFSIWYIQDYWEIGLLPEIASEAELELDPKQHSEAECTAHRAALFSRAKENLERAGLHRVKDLRLKKIFSKEALMEYLHSFYN